MQRLSVSLNQKPSYDILLTRDFSALGQELAAIELTGRKVCIITDEHVKDLYGQALCQALEPVEEEVHLYSFPEGEASKTLDTARAIYTFLIEHRFGRKDLIVALGGGVAGDLAGFAAATYMRGIDYIQVPTTLLAQTDSSIGGKTGVDFDGYKNMVGAFKMPRLVYMNLSTLTTLEDRQFFSGFAEVMKHGLIKDAKFYEWLIENMYEICERDPDVLEQMIYTSSSIKKRVVEKDPREQGERALLNFGHTIGHALEKHLNFTLYHGECVALGMVAAAYISWKRELLSMEEYYEVRDMFVPFYLPISIDNICPEEVASLTASDKKAENGSLRFILLKKIGKAFVEASVTEQEILDSIREIYYTEEDFHE